VGRLAAGAVGFAGERASVVASLSVAGGHG
jgi:hypothetical protein